MSEDKVSDIDIDPKLMESDASRAVKLAAANQETITDNTVNPETEKNPEELKLELKNEFNRLSELYKDAPDLSDQLVKARVSQIKSNEAYNQGCKVEEVDSDCVKVSYDKIYSNRRERLDVIQAEIEAVCRHAFAVNADNIIILDGGGRPYGIFVHEFLPIIRMEFCRVSGKKPEEIKVPEILFMNPGRGHLYDDSVPNERLLKGKHNLIFEESTNHFYEYGIKWDKLDISDQYKLFSGDRVSVNNVDDIDIYGEYHELKEKERQGVRGMLNSVGKLIPVLLKKIPGAIFESHIGGSSTNGGVLVEELGLRPYVGGKESNTSIPLPYFNEYIRDIHGLARAFAKRELDKIGRELGLVEEEQEMEQDA
jgi:hypothetical protein